MVVWTSRVTVAPTGRISEQGHPPPEAGALHLRSCCEISQQCCSSYCGKVRIKTPPAARVSGQTLA
jgi:hypothetical protein